MELQVFRGGDVVAVINTGGKNARFTYGLMGAHKIVVTDIKQYNALQVQLGDYIIRKGVKYKINTVPELSADDMLTYSVTFEGPKYTWHDKLFMHEGEADIPDYYGNALLLMQLFITNINAIDPGWTLGQIADTPEKHLVFSNVTCHEAIILISETFKLEFQEVGKVINMTPKIGRDTGLNFEYGMGKGLYNFTRTYVSDKNVVTKVYGFGGSRNLPVGYRGSKRKLTFDPGFKTNNIDLYGVKEGQYTNEDIIPEREASVTAVTHGNPTSTITDPTLDFNIKNQVIEGLEPKIGFTTGLLAGEEFVITDYNPTTKVITFKGFINNNNVVLPNATFKAAIGDKYVLYDMKMPDTYVTTAESRVNSETLQYVMDNSVPRVEYGGTIDPIHMRDNSIELMPGDRVNFKDARIGLNATIRITEISMPLDFPDVISSDTSIDVTIANFVTYSAQQRLRDDKLIQKHEVKTIDIRSVELARRNSANLLNLRDSIIDPDGNYYTEKIKPGSIETLFLSVGAKATNFNLNNVSFQANAGGNANSFTATAGQLIHYDIKLPDNTFIWEMQPYTVSGLVPSNKYFLYAKISKTTNVGSWELATDVKLAESIAGFYILQSGVLFPVKDGRRDNAITKGMVFIVGDQITAGRIKSLDNRMYTDYTTGELVLDANESGLEFNKNGSGRLYIRGGITQNAGGISAPLTVFRGPYVPGATYYNGDTVTSNGNTWLYKNTNPTNNQAPAENSYWTIYAQKGTDGTPGSPGSPGTPGNYTEFRFAKSGSTSTQPPIVHNDPNPLGWHTEQPTLGAAEYAWITSAIKNAAGALVSEWSDPTRLNGAKGDPGTPGSPGSNGPQGPFMTYRGDYDPLKTYVGNTTRIESLKYAGSYYVTRTDAGTIPIGTLPTNTTYFNAFGGHFESVATGLLLAELAYINNLGVRYAKTSEDFPRIEINGPDNSLKVFDAVGNASIILKDGKITTNSGLIAGFSLDSNGLENSSIYQNGALISGTGNSRIVASKKFLNLSGLQIGNKDLAIGNYPTPGYGETLNTLGFMENGEPGKNINTALVLSAYGGSVANWALRIESGDTYVKGNTALTSVIAYRNGNGSTKGMKFVNGLCVEVEISL